MHSWRKLTLVTLGCAGWLLLFPGMALAEADLVAEFGISRSEPVDKGFFFWEGRYVEAPYVVERRGLEVFVNGIRVARKPLGELEWPPYDYSISEDPGDPPPGLAPGDTPKGVDYRDTYWSRKWRYLLLHYDVETARQKMREAYARSDRVADVSVHPLVPSVAVVRMKSGETNNCGLHPDGWASKGWPKPTKDQVLKAVESTQSFYSRELDVAMVVAMSKGTKVCASHQQALEFLRILLSDKAEEEKRRLLGEHVGLRLDNAFLAELVRTPQASPQLARRVKLWEDEVAEKTRDLALRLRQQKDQAAEAKRQIAALKAQARHQTTPVSSEENAKATSRSVDLSSSSSQPATLPQAGTAPSALERAREEERREERPWVVEGRVTDEKNQPLARVEIVVRCGVGRLKVAGRTTSGPDGRYTLRFAAGTWSNLTPSRWQSARVAGHKEGFTLGNEWRDGDLFIAPDPPKGNYVGLPPDKMVLPNRPYRLDLVMTAVPVDKDAKTTPWGKAEEGVQLRIRPVQRVWRAGEKPAFKVDARNTGDFDFQLPENGTYAMIEVDGRWYAWDVDLAISLKAGGRGTKLLDLPPGQSLRDLTVELEDGWQAIKDSEVEELAFRVLSGGFAVESPDTPRQGLVLGPGKHTIRVAHVARPGNVWVRDELFATSRRHAAIRAVSNPVEIEILPAGSTNTAGEPATRTSKLSPTIHIFPPLKHTGAEQVAWSLREGLKAWPDGMQISFDTRTNTIIIQASEKDRPRLAYLVAQIDKPKSVETDEAAPRITKGFELKHAEATAVAEAIARLYPPSRAVNSWGTVAVRSDSGPNFVAIKCAAARAAEISALITLLDTTDLPDVQIIKLFPLDSSDAEDLASPMADLTEEAGIRCRIGPDPAANALIVQADAATLGIVGRLLKHLDRPGWPIAESRLRPEARSKQQKEREARVKISLLLDEATERVIASTGSADPSLVLRAFDTLAVRLCMDSLTTEQCGAVAAAALKVLTQAPSRSATDHVCVALLDDLRLSNRLTDEQQTGFFDSLITAEIKARPQSVLSIGIPARLTLSTRGKGTRLWFVIDSTGGLGLPDGPLSGGGIESSGPADSGSGTCGAVLKPRGLGPETIHATLNAKIYDWSFTGLLINRDPVLPAKPLHTISREITARTTVVEQEPPDYLRMTSDPALEGQIGSAISARKVSQRPWGLEVDIVTRKSPVDLAVAVVAVAGDRRTSPVTLCIPRNVDDNYPTSLGKFADVTHVDIVLTPDPKLARESVDLTEIWGKPIRFEHVPVVSEIGVAAAHPAEDVRPDPQVHATAPEQ